MNERIQKLAEQAAGNFTQTFRWEYTQQIDKDIFNKFAELIVNECIQTIHKQERLSPGYLQAQNALTHEYAIKKHFGVE